METNILGLAKLFPPSMLLGVGNFAICKHVVEGNNADQFYGYVFLFGVALVY
jgi:hypothetical protein